MKRGGIIVALLHSLIRVVTLPCSAAPESPLIYGIHDHQPAPTEFLHHITNATGTGGWITSTVAVGANPNDQSGQDFTPFSKAGHTVICRLNYGYFPDGTIPVPARWDDFGTRCRNFVANSTGCSIWLIGNESNLNAEWPLDPANNRFNYISPQNYAVCFRKVYNAIKAVRPNDRVIPQALAPWGGPYGPTDNLNGSGYPADGVPLNWVQYCNEMLTSIAASGPLDGIALHAGSRGYSYNDIHSTQKVSAGGQSLYWSFYVYKDWIDYGIPASLYHLPIYVTECNGLYYWKGGGPPGEDPAKHYEPGWVQEIFAEFNRYNQFAATAGKPIVRCVNFYRWCDGCDGWNIDGASNPYKTQILSDLDAALAFKYQWPTNQLATNAPPTPTNLVAALGNAKVTLGWSLTPFASGYHVQRSTASAGTYALIASNLSQNAFVDTQFTPGTTYYYRVLAWNSFGASAATPPVSARPTNGLPDVVVTNITWTPAGHLIAPTQVTLRCTVLNKGSASTAGQTIGVGFLVGGVQASWASTMDPVSPGASISLAASGGPSGVSYWTSTPGTHTVTAHADDINRFPEALEDNNALSMPIIVYPRSILINSGGPDAAAFTADHSWTGADNTYSVPDTIATTGISSPAPQAVYQTERWGTFTYNLTGLLPGANYTLRLHFAEIYWDTPGARKFHVRVNGSQVYTNLDILAEAGAKLTALVKQLNVVANAAGTIQVSFLPGSSDQPKCSGIELGYVSPQANTAPIIALIPDQLVNSGQSFSYNISAVDTNLPSQNLTYTILGGAPPGAVIDSSGVFTCTAPAAANHLTNTVFLRVNDNGFPPAATTASFKLITVAPPCFVSLKSSGPSVNLAWTSFPAKLYQVQSASNLTAPWQNSGLPVTATNDVTLENLPANLSAGFYRVLQNN